MPRKHTDIQPGSIFGRWTVLGPAPRDKNNKSCSVCQCACGSPPKNIKNGSLRYGDTLSCGCGQVMAVTKHGLFRNEKTRGAYQSWREMHIRCNAKPGTDYHRNYVLRGIAVCERWMDAKTFIEDMGERPPGMMLDRINNDGNYEPSNCRWADRVTQNRNRRPSSEWTFKSRQ